jgi:hypothetical protein
LNPHFSGVTYLTGPNGRWRTVEAVEAVVPEVKAFEALKVLEALEVMDGFL